jgi:hypothetical protein
MKRQRRRPSPKPRVSPSVLERLNPHAAGIDCGAAEHFVAVPPDRDRHRCDRFRRLPAICIASPTGSPRAG